MQKYNLMHKNEIIGLLKYDETTGRIVDCELPQTVKVCGFC